VHRPILSASLIAAAALALSAAPDPAPAAAACKGGQARWKVEGKPRCVKTRSLNTTAVRPLAATEVEYALRLAAQKARKPLGRALRRRAAALGNIAGTLQTRATATPAALRGRAGARLREVRSFEQSVPSQGGVSAKFVATADLETGALTIGGEFTTKAGKDTLTTSITAKISLASDPGCPDPTGRLAVRKSFGTESKNVTKRGGAVVESRTIEVTTATETVGQNGPDGFLRDISTTETTTSTVAERGLNIEQTTSATVAGAPGASVTLQGTPSSQAHVRSAELSRPEEAALERQLSAKAPSDPDLAKKLAEAAKVARDQIKASEPHWTYEGTNACLDVIFDPDTIATLEPGQTQSISAKQQITSSKLFVAATWSISAVEVGTLAGAGAAPASGATLAAVGGGPKDDFTVAGRVLSVSLAGRAARRWLAKGTPFPTVISATITQAEVAPGGMLTFNFTQVARWTRIAYQGNPDGSRSAEYQQDQASITSGHWKTTAGGCVWEGDVSGGSLTHPQTLDLVVDAAGTVRYGFAAEADLGARSFPKTAGPPECPASTGVAQLNAHATGRRGPGSSLYEAPAGALQGNKLHVERSDVSDSVSAQGGYQVTMGWTLDGS
jgi:hypothetical protein